MQNSLQFQICLVLSKLLFRPHPISLYPFASTPLSPKIKIKFHETSFQLRIFCVLLGPIDLSSLSFKFSILNELFSLHAYFNSCLRSVPSSCGLMHFERVSKSFKKQNAMCCYVWTLVTEGFSFFIFQGHHIYKKLPFSYFLCFVLVSVL